MAFEILIPIAIGAFAGQWLDNKFNNATPILTAVFSLLGVLTGLYIALKDFVRK
jgi:F0F1-type ATP synthase assembly protein I